MKKRNKIILMFLILPLTTLFFSYSKKLNALTVSKTVTFFAAQDNAVQTAGTPYSSAFSVTIPENAVTIKTAHIEISGISYNTSGSQSITTDLQGGIASDPKTYMIDLSTKAQEFNINYDATSIIFNTTAAYTLNLTGSATGGNFSIFSAKLILTYEYDSVQSTLLKTTEFFVGQENSKTAANGVITKNFSISAPETNPVLRSAIVEIGGVFKGSGAGTVQAGLYNSGASVNYKKSYAIDLGPQSTTKFMIRYDALSDMDIVNNKDYTFHFTSDKPVSSWSARLYLTYEHAEQGTYPITGYSISSTFDTGSAKGAAYNSIMWIGLLNGGGVRLQLATSNCPNGKTNPPACDDSGNWAYLGPDQGLGCLDTTYYENASGAPQEIKCYDDHNNKKYFRYKIILCSDPSCAISGSNNPQVDSVVVNWAP
ncbi:MAG: hypothetical protein WC788_04225 [Candidatus Paceibacterota bacterium]|jgi:hypothetical protein